MFRVRGFTRIVNALADNYIATYPVAEVSMTKGFSVPTQC
jgi:hypothetical protein